MIYKNTIITIIIVYIIHIPQLTQAIPIHAVLYADTGNLQNASIQKQAKFAAEKDAIQDTNRFDWFVTGWGCCLSTSACGFLGCNWGAHIYPPGGGGLEIDDSVLNGLDQYTDRTCTGNYGCMDEGFILGALYGGSLPFFVVYNYKINPSPEKLIGKSLEYVEQYTQTYKNKKRSIRTTMVITGFSTGCLSASFLYFLSDFNFVL